MKKKPQVSIIMGSDSDMPIMGEASTTLNKFGIAYEVRILSAHRTPKLTATFAETDSARGLALTLRIVGMVHLPFERFAAPRLYLILAPSGRRCRESSC